MPGFPVLTVSWILLRLISIESMMLSNRLFRRDFPGGPVVKNLPANTGHLSLIPEPGRSYMPQGLRVTTTEVHVTLSPCSATREATAMREAHTPLESSPQPKPKANKF